MQSPSTTAKFLKVTYVLFIKGGFLEGKRLQCHVISYSDRGSASKMCFLTVCSEETYICLGALSLTEICHVPQIAVWEHHIISQTYLKYLDITGVSLVCSLPQFQDKSHNGLITFVYFHSKHYLKLYQWETVNKFWDRNSV